MNPVSAAVTFDNTSERTCPHHLACSNSWKLSADLSRRPRIQSRFTISDFFSMWITIWKTETPGRTHPTNASASGPQHVSADVSPLQKKGQRNPSDLQGTDGQMLRFCRGMRQLCAIHLTCCTEGKQKQQIFVRFEILTTSNRTTVLHNSKSQALLYLCFSFLFWTQRERNRDHDREAWHISRMLRSQWPRGLRSVAARLLGLWVRIPPGTWRSVCCEWCVLSGRARAERDGTRAETTFLLSPKRTSSFKSAGKSVQSTAGSRGVRISFSNAG